MGTDFMLIGIDQKGVDYLWSLSFVCVNVPAVASVGMRQRVDGV